MAAQVMDLRGVKVLENETKRKLRSDLAREKGERKGERPTEGFTQCKKTDKDRKQSRICSENKEKRRPGE